ncbi:MAG TPA: 30S ribosome-binding factor RbfA, partial [Anaerovoracaceae bacterium]|nr:30S ribosome-binding factor RbfA [Anaerovoracaceae bacterium]
TLYISVLDNTDMEKSVDKKREEVLEAFQSAKGLIRREIGKQIKLRHVPEILFKIDTSLEYGRHISRVLAELDTKRKDEDEEK